jgi:hypothetical protein
LARLIDLLHLAVLLLPYGWSAIATDDDEDMHWQAVYVWEDCLLTIVLLFLTGIWLLHRLSKRAVPKKIAGWVSLGLWVSYTMAFIPGLAAQDWQPHIGSVASIIVPIVVAVYLLGRGGGSQES